MPIPEKKDIFFEKRLRSQLIERFVRPETNYIWHYRIAAGVACFFAVFTFVMLFFPTDSAQRIAKNESIEPMLEKSAKENPAALETILHSDSDDYQTIANELGKKQLDNDKTYLIKRYITDEQKTVTIVTEINPEVKPMTVQRKINE